ncbi:hypothetical protein EJ04DRAFT_508740 [Polyplosphaeria fusca]|uniref:Transmembrane protein n=1 Tax=Polyplosphaeria fusca TaxID=682080 RepID=A0A9P4V644_9PLEO|nr:hypothetical protein EJ04DRAFT_508740 [Polyplosphaeria fusca]
MATTQTTQDEPQACSLPSSDSGPQELGGGATGTIYAPLAEPTHVSGGLSPQTLRRCIPDLRPKTRLVVKRFLSLCVFVLSVIALWASVSSAVDARRATRIAEWTAHKDFLEHCEEHAWSGSKCEVLRDVPLHEPPGFHFPDGKRWAIPRQNVDLDQIELDVSFPVVSNMYWLIVIIFALVGLALSRRKLQQRKQ